MASVYVMVKRFENQGVMSEKIRLMQEIESADKRFFSKLLDDIDYYYKQIQNKEP